jgi:hypothetical protein
MCVEDVVDRTGNNAESSATRTQLKATSGNHNTQLSRAISRQEALAWPYLRSLTNTDTATVIHINWQEPNISTEIQKAFIGRVAQ